MVRKLELSTAHKSFQKPPCAQLFVLTTIHDNASSVSENSIPTIQVKRNLFREPGYDLE